MADGQRVAFVSGAARGIGLAVAEAFLAEGYRVAIGDRDVAEATA
jgi:NAD(P)-dependent dehydrogenase (short-subunit alcohol dehydrogenase family)